MVSNFLEAHLPSGVINLTHIQRLKFSPQKLHLEHCMVAQDRSNVRNVTLAPARKSSTKSQTGSMIPIPSLNFLGFTAQPVLEKLRSPKPLQKFAIPSWEGASFSIDIHLGVMIKRSLSRRWCTSLPSSVQGFAMVLSRPSRGIR